MNAFLHHLGRTGSVTIAANRARLRRGTLYRKRQDDEAFAGRWAWALDRGKAAGSGAVPRASRPVRDAGAAPSP